MVTGDTVPGGHDQVPSLTWAGLVAQATLGTARRPDAVVGGVAGLVPPAAGGTEQQLLSAAAMRWTAGRASRRAELVEAVDVRWDPPPDDQAPVAEDQAVQLLEVVLSGGVVTGATRRRLILRWATATHAAGRRLPARLITPVIEGTTGPLPPAIMSVLGEQGRWVLALNPAWARRRPRPSQDGGSASIAPDTARTDRMGARLQQLVTVRHRLVRGVAITLDDTVQPSGDDLADAAGAPPASGVVGWWQQQVLTAAPLAAWVTLTGSTQAVIEAQRADPAVLRAVCAAAVGQRDRRWVELLLPVVLDRHEPDPSHPPPLRTVAWTAWVRLVADLLAVLPEPWADTVTRQLLAWMASHPSPVIAIDGVGELLATGAGPLLDQWLTGSPYSGADAEAVNRALGRLRTVRSLQHAIDGMSPPPPADDDLPSRHLLPPHSQDPA